MNDYRERHYRMEMACSPTELVAGILVQTLPAVCAVHIGGCRSRLFLCCCWRTSCAKVLLAARNEKALSERVGRINAVGGVAISVLPPMAPGEAGEEGSRRLSDTNFWGWPMVRLLCCPM